MTPLEKASQMIVDYQLTIKSLSYEEAVQCSIRTVDEIIYEIIKYADNSRQYVVGNIKYWQEVRELLEKQVNKMTLRHALLILESHQKWRMGDEFTEATEPKVLTEAINTILQYHIGSTTALIDQIVDTNEMVDQVPDVRKMVEDDKETFLLWVRKNYERCKTGWIDLETGNKHRIEADLVYEYNQLHPTSSQTEISDEEIEKHKVFLRKAGVLDIDIENWAKGAKWYREQLKKKQ